MKKNKSILIISLIGTFMIGGFIGFYVSDQMGNKTAPVIIKPKTEINSVYEKELNIDSEFIHMDPLVYDDDHLKTKIYLNEKGKAYNSTELYSSSYTVTISLYNMQYKEPYFVIDEFDWDINEDLVIDAPIDSELITDKDKLSDYKLQLEKLKKGEDHKIHYHIEVLSSKDGKNVADVNGTLQIE